MYLDIGHELHLRTLLRIKLIAILKKKGGGYATQPDCN